MKKSFFLVLVTLLAVQLSAQFNKASLQATGLTCALCSNAVNKALLKLPFVESVQPDIKNSSFAIVFKQDAAINIDALKNAVEDAGFSIGSLKLTGKFNGLQIANEQPVQISDKEFCFLNVSNQTLNGEKTLTVVDKNFMTAKDFKKISGSTKMNCLQTGKAASCCGGGLSPDTRVYHVTI